ncbi:hypothetical protein X943_002812 [Babesia divergens]|uniref:Uncharacterized protein n=1 Tax=Babesia divergens TaxID=32595 RepID=A0AAD9LDC0_BABDI|nr:hypothetical protein X943_002812 [Babesia divergens]
MKLSNVVNAVVSAVVVSGLRGLTICADVSAERRLTSTDDTLWRPTVRHGARELGEGFSLGSWFKQYGLILLGPAGLGIFLVVVYYLEANMALLKNELKPYTTASGITASCCGIAFLGLLCLYCRDVSLYGTREDFLRDIVYVFRTFMLPFLLTVFALYLCFVGGYLIYFKVKPCDKCSQCSGGSGQCKDCTKKFFGCCCCCLGLEKEKKCDKCKSDSGSCRCTKCSDCVSKRKPFIAVKSVFLGVLFCVLIFVLCCGVMYAVKLF